MQTSVFGRTWQKTWLRVGLLVLLAGRLDAATFWVTNTLDDGPGSLRQAISNASAAGGGAIIFTNTTGTISLASTLSNLTGNLNILGPGTNLLTVSGSNSRRVLTVSTSATVFIAGLAIANGYAADYGGGIVNAGDLTIKDCLLQNNQTADSYYGGAIYNSGNLTLISSRFFQNAAYGTSCSGCYGGTGRGGGLYTQNGNVSITNCNFYLNTAAGGAAAGTAHTPYPGMSGGSGYGGAIYIQSGSVTIGGSTISGNGAYGGNGQQSGDLITPGSGGDAYGGAIFLQAGSLVILNSTISLNRCAGGTPGFSINGPASPGTGTGGGICSLASSAPTYQNVTIYSNSVSGSTTTLGGGIAGGANICNSIVASNSLYYMAYNIYSWNDTAGWVNSLGFNLVTIPNSSGWISSDLLSVTPNLGPLQDNGGPTPTHALLAGSPAINAGTSVGAPAYDQRGVPRPQGGAVDIGALETCSLIIVSLSSNQTVNLGAAATISVMAAGIPPFSYLWRKQGTPLTDATNATLSFASAQSSNAGSYSVIITNAYGAVTSAVSTLTVGFAPAITNQPQSRTNVVDTSASFSVTATGAEPLFYQWRRNGTNRSGATASLFQISNVQVSDVGNYLVVVTNLAGSVTSQVATLTVLVPPSITSQPQSRTNVVNTSASFSVTASGTAPLSYQWRRYETNLIGAPGSTLNLASVQLTNAGDYTVVVTNAAGSVTSQVATLTVLAPPSIALQPQSRTNLVGTVATFSVVATGTRPFSYQWRRGSTNLAGATTSIIQIGNVQAADAGNYAVVVTNIIGSVTSQVATLTVVGKPGIDPKALALTNGIFSLRITNTLPGSPVIIEASSNLVQWTPIRTNTPAGSVLDYSEAVPPDRRARFFRAKE